MPTTATKVGVADNAAGAGVAEMLGLQGPLAALVQAMSVVPHGDPWQIAGGTTWTPTAISETLPPQPIMSYKVPVGKALLWLGGHYHLLTAATEYLRVIKRTFLFGYQATAAPAAPAAPAVALHASTDGIGTAGIFSYKTAPIDTFRQEGPLSVASATVTLTATNRCVTVTPAALGTGAIGYNIYRTLAGGATYYYVDTVLGAVATVDALPDASVDITLVPSNLWATGAITGDVMDGPGEVTVEVGAVAVTNVATALVYRGLYSDRQRMVTGLTIPTTIGSRAKLPVFLNNNNFINISAAGTNPWRGRWENSDDIRLRPMQDYGALQITGLDPVPTAGALMFFGHQVLGACERFEAAAAIHAQRIEPFNKAGTLLGPRSEIVVEIAALAAGVAAQRHVSLYGLLLPTTGT